MKLKLTCTKSKDHEPPEPMYFKPEVIDLGVTVADGEFDIETSVVLVHADSERGCTPPPPKLTRPQQFVLDALREAATKHQRVQVHIDQWREVAMQKSICDSSVANSKSKAFSRCYNALLSKGYVVTNNDFYWPRT